MLCTSSTENDTTASKTDVAPSTTKPVINDVRLVSKATQLLTSGSATVSRYATTRRGQKTSIRAREKLDPGRPSDDSCLPALMQSTTPGSTFNDLPLSVTSYS